MENKSKRSRTDDTGRAYAGSQRHLQTWVNDRPAEIGGAILDALQLAAGPSELTWVSPLANKGYSEYRDSAFMAAIGCATAAAALSSFWPRGGPVWDGLAILESSTGNSRKTVILVEAKSYPEEVHGNGCQAKPDGNSRKLIEASLTRTAAWLGVTKPDSWTGYLYQPANRIAHAYFLREVQGIDTHLVNVCFTNDSRRPTTQEQWLEAHRKFRRELGLENVPMPWLADVVLPAEPLQ